MERDLVCESDVAKGQPRNDTASVALGVHFEILRPEHQIQEEVLALVVWQELVLVCGRLGHELVHKASLALPDVCNRFVSVQLRQK